MDVVPCSHAICFRDESFAAISMPDFTNINVHLSYSTPFCTWTYNATNSVQDPAGIKALLDQLRSSQAWQDSVNSSGTASTPTRPTKAPETPLPASSSTLSSVASASQLTSKFSPSPSSIAETVLPASSTTPTLTPSVASLLSQLQSSPHVSALIGVPSTPHTFPPANATTSAVPASSHHLPSDPYPANNGASSVRKQDLRACTFQQSLPYLARLSEDSDFIEAIRRVSVDFLPDD